MKYEIIAHLESGKEVVDDTDTRKDADYLVGEYSMAFKCYCSIKTVREPISEQIIVCRPSHGE